MGKPWIDISEFNTITDWSKVKKNVDCVIIRMGLRGSRDGKIRFDKKYKENRKSCEDYKIPHGFYFFPTAVTDEEAIEEAAWVAKQLNGTDAFVLPLFADSEKVQADSSGRSDRLDKATRTRLLKVFIDRLQSKGIPSGVYASTSWLENNLDMAQLPYSVWVAQYAPKCSYKGDYILWQYTSKGTVPGVSGNVDISVRHDSQKASDDYFSVDRVINLALSEVGYVEKKNGDLTYLFDKTLNAGDKNYTKYGREMHRIYPSVMDYPAPWCDAFVDWLFYSTYGVANARKMLGGDFDDYTVRSAALYKSKGAWHTTPKRGDQIFFRNSSGICHTGLVYHVDAHNVYTIEGNTSAQMGVVANGGMVAKKWYDRGYSKIAGYGRPLYAENKNEPPVVDVSRYPTIRKGARGEYVRKAQTILSKRGFTCTVDGIFGKETESKTIAFQKSAFPGQPKEWDGIIGQKTWKALSM